MVQNLIIKNSVLEIGLDKPIRFLHITDAHIDVIKAEGKYENTDYYEAAMKYAEENNLSIICTGDNFKGISEDNMEYAAANLPSGNNIILPGNHDFCKCPDNFGLSDSTYMEEYSKIWAPYYSRNIYFDSVIIGGINFVIIQNVYYSITYKQIELLKKEVSKGYPIILCMHIPLFTTEKADEMLATWAGCAYMIAPPEKYYKKYCERHREEQIPVQETLDAVEYIENEPAIKAVIAGHIHEDFDGYADCGKRQITTAPLKEGAARVIEIR